MDKVIVTEENWQAVIEQWLFLFMLLSVIFLPGILFANQANRNGRRGWVYFLAGLAVGILALTFSSLIGRLLRENFALINDSRTIIAIFLVNSGSIIAVFDILFKNWLTRKRR